MRLRLARWFGVTVVTVVAVVTSACGSSAPGGATSGSGTGSTPGPVTRVAELATTGGFVGNGQSELRPPQMVVYSDGMVVLDGAKKTTIPVARVTELVAGVAKDLHGQPAVLNLKHSVPDVSSAVLGVRQKDGSYQLVKAAGLRELGSDADYPAAVLDAFGKLRAAMQSAAAGPTEPYTSDTARLVYVCAPSSSADQPWPAGLPQPKSQQAGANCTESQVVGGDVAKAAQTACRAWDTSSSPPIEYAVDQSSWTCQWRPALPDEK